MPYPPFTEADIARLAGPGLRTFFNIAREWRLDEGGQMRVLGIEDASVLERWREGDYASVVDDTMIRLSFILGIYMWARELVGTHEETAEWMSRPYPDPAFLGRSPLEWIAEGKLEDLHYMRHLLMVSAIAQG
ncbi:DUF2384 domain-containing protein (plasmid) [Novosphingobium sp. BL-8H]|uniref:DUF2384 domain-containing protein n=1 Tax=Novosphingobium sp. BL-8H TaxID=3127640 RepID=UPI0037577EA8